MDAISLYSKQLDWQRGAVWWIYVEVVVEENKKLYSNRMFV